MLWIAVTARNAGIRPSELLEIGNKLLALNFDLVAADSLFQDENRRQRDFARTVGAACALAFNGETLKFDDEGGSDAVSEKEDDDYITI